MPNLLSADQFRAQLRAKRTPTDGVFRISAAEPTVVQDASRTLRFCFSDGAVDRMGDTIDAKGWETQDFDNNPVALWAHDSSSPPIGRASNLAVEDAKLMGDIEFAPPQTYAFAETIFQLLTGKFLRAVSVGFLPLEYSFVENDPKRAWGIDFKRQQLLEISVCPVPANPNALANARSKGIDTRPLFDWAEQMLDGAGHGKTLITNAELERLRKAAKEPPMATRKPRRRADGAGEDDPTAGGDVIGSCGRDKDEPCGMKDPKECSIHSPATKSEDDDKVDPNDEKALRAALRKLTGKRVILRADDDPDPDPDDPPMAHEDAIRMAHKCLRTSKAFMTEGMTHHAKALDLLKPVVDAMDEDHGGDGDPGGDTADPDKEKQIAIAARLRSQYAH